MKTNNLLCVERLSLLILALALQGISYAQPPIYSFKNPVLVSGVSGQVNAVYRFPNVYTGLDARVKIVAKTGGISLVSIDRTLDGYAEAFQPEYQMNANSNGYFEFQVTFVKAGTTTPMEQLTVDVSGLDIDGTIYGGKSLREFNRIDMKGGICHFDLNYNEIAVTEIGDAFEATNVTGNLYGTLVDTAASAVMYSVRSYYVDTFYYRVGSYNQMAYGMSRYASLYFKRFTYPNQGVLSTTNLESFTGLDQDNSIRLQWSLTVGNSATSVVLEKQVGEEAFSDLVQYWVNMEGNTQRAFTYTDGRTEGKAVGYRLRITDASGKVGYSNILYFRNRRDANGMMTIYPTITSEAVTVNYSAIARENATILVLDMSGRVMKKESVLLQKGNNSFRVGGFDRYRSGAYVLVMQTPSGNISQQLIVQ